MKNRPVEPSSPRDLLRADPKGRDAYGNFSLVRLTAYSVHWLAAWGIPTTYENVSVLSARLFPADFAMEGFPEFPDALRTNRSLLQMRPNQRGLATSDPRKGVFLTERGRDDAARVTEVIGPPTFEGKAAAVEAPVIDRRRSRKGRERTYSPAQILEDARSRLLFRRFQDGRLTEADVVHLLGLLGLYDHTPPVEVRREFKHLRNAALAVGDDEFLAFLDAVQRRFHNYINRSDTSKRRE